jgi:hypothetical protein
MGAVFFLLMAADECHLICYVFLCISDIEVVLSNRLFDVEQFHTLHGPGALIATPLPGADAPPARNAIGGYTSTAVGAFLVDLDVQPATPVELRCAACTLFACPAKMQSSSTAPVSYSNVLGA